MESALRMCLNVLVVKMETDEELEGIGMYLLKILRNMFGPVVSTVTCPGVSAPTEEHGCGWSRYLLLSHTDPRCVFQDSLKVEELLADLSPEGLFKLPEFVELLVPVNSVVFLLLTEEESCPRWCRL